MRRVLLAILAVSLGALAPLFVAEMVLRFLPVNEGLRAQPVGVENPLFHFQPNRTSTWSRHWNFDIVNQVRTNNYGFVNDVDYERHGGTPLLAVIGDSFIEAAMVPFGETIQGRLAAELEDRGRVYSLAASGAPLSQYLVWAEFARTEFKPQGLVVSVIANDVNESLYDHGSMPGFHRFQKLPDGGVRLVRQDFKPGLARRVLRHSAVVMYVMTHLELYERIRSLDFAKLFKDDLYVVNVPAGSADRRLESSKWAANVFLDQLPTRSGLDPSRILIVVDGYRPHMYEAKLLEQIMNSYWGNIRRYFMAQATTRGYAVVDLHPIFMERYVRHKKRFEFPTDAHWNSEGHAVVADAVRASRVFRQVFAEMK